ncbi:hypothetical protein ACFRCI_36305 [Streptomyces sp. NPDC056638]|uniref:hypothetical protein n=1 Tax=Streptomyces sp. NPDC056638 TaxID=3345887 RepID=UPI00369AB7A2
MATSTRRRATDRRQDRNPGGGHHPVAPAKTERGRGDVLQTALAHLLLPGQGQQRSQAAVTVRHLLGPGTFMRRTKSAPIEIEERSRPEDIEDRQHRAQTGGVDELFVGSALRRPSSRRPAHSAQ